MKRKMTTKLAAVGSLAVLALAGAACESSDTGATSPGQEAPADDLGTTDGTGTDTGTSDLGTSDGMGTDTGADTGADAGATG